MLVSNFLYVTFFYLPLHISFLLKSTGRIACELSSADELLLTEMVFNGLFNEMTPAQSAAILSCFVCDEKSNEMPKLTQELSGPLRQMQDMAKQIAKVSKEAKIEIDEEKYISKFKPFMMDVVFEVNGLISITIILRTVSLCLSYISTKE